MPPRPSAAGVRVGSGGAILTGLHTRPAAIRHEGTQFGTQLVATPRGARALFGAPAAELAHHTLPLAVAPGPNPPSLVDRLRSEPSRPGRFAIFDDELGRLLRDVPEPAVARGWWHHGHRPGPGRQRRGRQSVGHEHG